MKLKSLVKSKVFEEFNEILPKIKRKGEELDQLTLFMEKKREIGRKSGK